MCGVWVKSSPACRHRRFACLLHLALPLTVEVRANGFANCAQAVTATCEKAAAQCSICVIWSRVLLAITNELQATNDTTQTSTYIARDCAIIHGQPAVVLT